MTSLNGDLNGGSAHRQTAPVVVEASQGAQEEANSPEDTTFQQQIIVEANMARSEMDQRLPSGNGNNNSQEFLNDTAQVFHEDEVASSPSEQGKQETTADAEVVDVEAERELDEDHKKDADNEGIITEKEKLDDEYG